MSVIVNGKIYFSSGGLAEYLIANTKFHNYGEGNINIQKGVVKIVFGDISKSPFELYHIAYDIANTIILMEEVKRGKGLIFLPETVEKDGVVSKLDWQISINLSMGINQKDFVNTLALNTQFRYGVMDFHLGLIDNKNSPTHFYRAIESFRNAVTKRTTHTTEDWQEFKSKINLIADEERELDFLTELSTSYRHGDRTDLLDYIRILKITEILAIKTYDCICQKATF